MKKSDLKILIIEDDASLGQALVEALKRHGYQCKLVSGSQEAKQQLKLNSYHALVCDVLLPRVNGVDLIMDLKENRICPDHVVLTSGIFRDRSFIREAIQSTGALAFLQKPFDLQQLTDTINQAFREILEPERDPLESLKSRPNASPKEVIEILMQVENCAGFDLPYLMSLAVRSQFTGHLQLIGSDGSKSSLTWHQGKIIEVVAHDKRSYFGVLLVEMGFTSFDEVQEILVRPSEKPIGQRLVEAHALSPHAIHLVLREQMTIRLSKIVQPIAYEVKFSQTEVKIADDQVFVDETQWHALLADWISAKCSTSWLESKYATWMEHPLAIRLNAAEREMVNVTPLLFSQKDLLNRIDGSRTLQELLDSAGDQASEVLRAIHYLVISRAAHFEDKKVNSGNYDQMIRRLRQMAAVQAQQDFFEILSVNHRSPKKDISRAYMELAKVIHPDKIDPSAPLELKDLAQKVFARVTEAYDTLSDDKKRDSYRQQLDKGAADSILQAETQFEDGKRYLSQGRFQKALERFAAVRGVKNHRSDLCIYLAWAKLKIGAPTDRVQEFNKEISRLLSEVPPEDRHSAPFMFVKGLYYKNTGDFPKAMTNFKNAHTLDSGFIEAKREALSLKENYRSNQEKTFSGEITSVVSNLFGKKRR